MTGMDEGVWREGDDIVICGRTGQANRSILAVLSLVLTLFVCIPIAFLVRDAVTAAAPERPAIGPSPVHVLGWGLALPVCLFLGIVLARITYVRHALARRIIRLQFGPDALQVGGRRFDYAAMRKVRPAYTAGLRGALRLVEIIVWPLDSLARSAFGWIAPAAFRALPGRSACVGINGIRIRTYFDREENALRLADAIADEISLRMVPGA
ncbi:MAG: hypothetical protein R3C00_10595 [Hyphomonas sp.]